MAHALLSPSGASRWIACTPSARLESKFKDESSTYADEGTLAHKVSETLLAYENGLMTKEEHDKILDECRESCYFVHELFMHSFAYSDYVTEHMTDDAKLYIEQRFDLSKYVPESFGTSDATVVKLKSKLLQMFDLKYGKKLVSAQRNKQLMLYALGALDKFDPKGVIKTVEMTIYQPRLDNIDMFRISVEELREWAEKELKPRAKLAFEGKGEFVAGDHCFFCKAKVQCKALYEYNMALARLEFADPDLMTDDEVLEVINKADIFKNWISGVTEYALKQAINGKKYKGLKVVHGKSNRVYTDPAKIAEVLETEGLDMISGIYKERQLLGITELEKSLGKQDFAKFVGPYVEKPKGAPTFAPESDNRLEYGSPADDFNDGYTDPDEDDLI